ncbi:MAG: hypothetical protein M3179_13770 [Actinomycetota bacterium]|nr:hypothetical protein [Actinomycetota bacterium]
MKVASGTLPRGAEYLVEAPPRWNGTVFLYSHGRVDSRGAPNTPSPHLRDWLLAEGSAVAGSCYRPEAGVRFWQLEEAFEDQPALLDEVGSVLGTTPEVVVAWGHSIGGLISAGLVHTMGDRLAGAVPLCAPLAGGVATLNTELDCAFVFNTLVAGEAPLELVNIERPERNLERALTILREAQATSIGRARIALAAAVTNTGAWADPASAAPPGSDFSALQRNHFRWFADVGFTVYFWARAQVEQRAGGNPSWNTGVDYSELLTRSVYRAEVEALYAEAGASLDADLATLAEAGRIAADTEAVHYLTRHIAFDGKIDLPVVVVHGIGDGLCGTNHTRAYRDAVLKAGRGHDLLQLYVRRGGHCAFTVEETVVALRILLDRIRRGAWRDDIEFETPTDVTATTGSECCESTGYGLPSSGSSDAPAFTHHEPPEFLRPFDLAGASEPGTG